MTEEVPERMLTADEVAEILGLHPRTIQRGRVPGLHPVKVTRRAVRFRVSDVQAVVDGRVGSAEASAGGEESDVPASERDALLSAAANDLVRMLVDENVLPVTVVNEKIIPLLNERWTALFEAGDEQDADDDGDVASGNHVGPGDEHEQDEDDE